MIACMRAVFERNVSESVGTTRTLNGLILAAKKIDHNQDIGCVGVLQQANPESG